jgi:hypothetical protein
LLCIPIGGSLPGEILENLTRPEGHVVPRGVEALVSKIQSVRSQLDSEYRMLRKDYDAYVAFCNRIGVPEVRIHSQEQREESEYSRRMH